MHPSLMTLYSDVKDRAGAASSISLFLDFDGTLVPIAADPAASRLDPSTVALLKLLAHQQLLTTTVISGRAVEDLYGRIRLERLIYAGNHGLEIFGRSLTFVEPSAWEVRLTLQRLCEDLGCELRLVAGVSVEYKGLTATVHYRQASLEHLPLIQRAVYSAAAPYGANFRVNPGRKAFEILPRTDWHKGSAVGWINRQLDQKEPLSIYLGDDTSDEDAFSSLGEAITVKVGTAPITCAKHRLPDPAAVHEFLLWLALPDSAMLCCD
jgi:trehalose 6-phosphate phosphatase